MKRRPPRLVINMETLRTLNVLELGRVIGGEDIRDTRASCPAIAVAPKP